MLAFVIVALVTDEESVEGKNRMLKLQSSECKGHRATAKVWDNRNLSPRLGVFRSLLESRDWRVEKEG
jgi:hypothetical protein